MEEWKPIPKFPDYEASSAGNFRRIAPGKGTYINKPRKTYQNPVTKYLNVTFSSKGERTTRTFSAHRIIAEVFIPNPNNLPQVNHINKDRTDNRIENLEWVTARENSHGTKLNAVNIKTGEEKFFFSINQASIELGITTYSINQILNGELLHAKNWGFTKHSR